MKPEEIDKLARILWDYNNLEQPLEKADLIFVLGSSDIRVAHRAVDLFKEGFAPIVVFSGGYGRLTKEVWNKPEAEVFSNEAIKLGVPKDKILIETESANTGENVQFTKKLLKENNIDPASIIAVQKPYMLRRTYATLMKQWPGQDFMVTGPEIDFDDYFTKELSKDLVISILVGDTQRIKEYPTEGFQIPQEIPDQVWKAYEQLVELGYTQHLINTTTPS
ncbi:hypothetical protein COB18_04010 [Candidatus Kaiserbacteria bacterium]|nr:MAG: hypothetical protein COB18_04010 [Candidatus Kaiserbacteria bacterium]